LIKSRIPKFHFIKSLFIPLILKTEFVNVDIIKTNQIDGSWIACIAKIIFNKKVIIRAGFDKLRRHLVLANKKGIKNLLKYVLDYFWIYINEFLAYKIADGIILTSNQDIAFIIKAFKLNNRYKKNIIQNFSNYVDITIFKPLNVPKKDKHILFIGRLTEQKNLFNLIKAFKDLDEFYLDIIGVGSLKNKLIDKAKRLGIQINFLGVYPNHKLPEIINQYEIFILPSYWEGNPKVLLEAMSCGLSCIGSNIQGINNIIKHKENGYFCELTPTSIKNAILDLYKNESLRKQIGINARKYILENCSLKILSEKEYLFYKEVLRR